MKYAKFSDDFLSYFRLDDNGETLVLTDKQGCTRAVKLLPYEERPQGKWIEYKEDDEIMYYCSNCMVTKGQAVNNFCACCGADMRGKTDQLRDCENCVHHSDNGCEVWECEFEKRSDV